MTNYETGAVRDTGGKGRMDLLPMCALLRISRHMENANTHYPERNWEKGLPMHSMIDSALRHLVKYMDGQMDEDHLCAAATNLLMALWTEEKLPEMQDIPSRVPRGSENTSPCARSVTVFALDGGGATSIPPEHRTQKKAIPVARRKCPSYDDTFGLCNGTEEREMCYCKGDESNCDFYSWKRTIRAKLPPNYE